MPISLPDDWGKEEALSEKEQSLDKDSDGSKCEKCDAYKEALTDLGKIMLPVGKTR